MPNENLIAAIHTLAQSLRVDPVTAVERVSIGGIDLHQSVWLWLNEVEECPQSFISFVLAIADNPKRDDLKGMPWFKEYAAVLSDLNARAWGGIDNKNEWGIAPQLMRLSAPLFNMKGRIVTAKEERENFLRWMAARSSYPERWLKRKDIVIGLQAKHAAAQIEAMLAVLIEENRLMYKTSDNAKGRPGLLYAVKHEVQS